MIEDIADAEYIDEIEDEGSLHDYRTEIPNIIFQLGLDPFQIALYLYYKKVAGDRSKCFQSQKFIASVLKMTDRKLRDVKKSLEQPFELLNGNPLIRVTARFKPNSKEKDTDLITIVDIWKINFQIISTCGTSFRRGAECHSAGAEPRSDKEDPYKKNPYKKKEKQEKEMGVNPQTPRTRSSSSKKIERAPHVELTEHEHQELISRIGPEKLEAAYKKLSEWKQDTPRSKWKKSDFRSIERWVLSAIAEEKQRKEKLEKTPDMESNSSFARRIAENYNMIRAPKKGVKIEVSSQYLEFLFPKAPGSQPICIPLKSHGFKDQVENALRKTGLQ